MVSKHFDERVKPQTDIPKDKFMNLLKFCLVDCNYFCYKGDFVKMKNGLFMGSSLAPILVEWVLDEVINSALMKVDFVPQFWKAYVDDHITAIPRDKIEIMKEALESFDPLIKFTYEIEDDRSSEINYLDITVKRNTDGSIITNWFHKPIASNRILNFYSSHPQRMKFNTVKNFIRRVFSFSHKCHWNDNLVRIDNILRKNNYPIGVIKKLIASVRSDNVQARIENNQRFERSSYRFLSNNSTNNNITQSSNKMYSALSYVPDLSESLARSCEYFVPEFRAAMRPAKQISTLFKNTKHKIPNKEKSGLVYGVQCNDCEKIYIGETIQKLGTRMDQHSNECNKVQNGTANVHKIAALANHVSETGHSFDFDNAKILRYERNKFKLQVHEVNQIIKHEENACNFKTDKKDYTNTYYNLIKNEKN